MRAETSEIPYPAKDLSYDLRLTIDVAASWQAKLVKVITDTCGDRNFQAAEIAQSYITLCDTAQWPEAGQAFLTTCGQDGICGQMLVNVYKACQSQLAPTACLILGINTGLIKFAQLLEKSLQPLSGRDVYKLSYTLQNRLNGFARLHALADFHDSNVEQCLSWPTRPEPRHHVKTKDDFPRGLRQAQKRLRAENPAFH